MPGVNNVQFSGLHLVVCGRRIHDQLLLSYGKEIVGNPPRKLGVPGSNDSAK